MNRMRRLRFAIISRVGPALLVLCCFAFCSCRGIYFYPKRELLSTPDDFKIAYEDIEIKTADGLLLDGWRLPAIGERKGVVLQFHGNAENMSTHIFSVYWLPKEGYEVITFDYRGFGESEGSASLPEVLLDAKAALRFADDQRRIDSPCLFVVGQSIGGAIAILALEEVKPPATVNALIVDSSFSDFDLVLREVLQRSWLLSPLSYILPHLTPRLRPPRAAVAALQEVPLLFIHGEQDTVVSPSHSETLFEAAPEPKQLWRIEGAGHIEALNFPFVREKVLDYFSQNCVGRYQLASQ